MIQNKELKTKYVMGGLVLICFLLSAAYVFTPTTWTLNINMDNNTLEAVRAAERIQDKNLQVVRVEKDLCGAYSNLSFVQTTIKNNELYYFINNRWITEKTLWESCLR